MNPNVLLILALLALGQKQKQVEKLRQLPTYLTTGLGNFIIVPALNGTKFDTFQRKN